mmetsp:Transcript_34372/g.110845  ORF Transcript_34372/g.110845 Transcript_34372/m.110845 type:complete len:373 (+) Transcript_34372:99-1217(+)
MSSSGSASGACGSPDVPPPEAEGESTLSAAPLSPAVLRAPCWSGSAGGGGPPAAGGGGGGGPSSAGGGGPSSASGGGCPAAPPPCPPPSPCTVAWATEEGRPAGGCSCGGLARTMKLHPAAPPPAPPLVLARVAHKPAGLPDGDEVGDDSDGVDRVVRADHAAQRELQPARHLGERVGHVVVASAHQPERRRPDDLQRLAVERPAAACARPADRTAPDDGAVGEQRHLGEKVVRRKPPFLARHHQQLPPRVDQVGRLQQLRRRAFRLRRLAGQRRQLRRRGRGRSRVRHRAIHRVRCRRSLLRRRGGLRCCCAVRLVGIPRCCCAVLAKRRRGCDAHTGRANRGAHAAGGQAPRGCRQAREQGGDAEAEERH